jgi:hypothetical protein
MSQSSRLVFVSEWWARATLGALKFAGYILSYRQR